MANEAKNILSDLSDSMAQAVEKASPYTLLVDGRRRFPATGIAYGSQTVLTADHVVERDEEIRVVVEGGAEYQARVAGRDPGSDLAVLTLENGSLTPAKLAEKPGQIGQLVLALGRPNTGGIQASMGVISSQGGPTRTGRGGMLERYWRTDAVPYPGFSGGPLIDLEGKVLGLNTSGLTRGGAVTIPASLAWQVAETLAKHGRVRRGYLGIRSQPVAIPEELQRALGREQRSGLLIVGVEAGTSAQQAGLLIGDILVALGEQPVRDPDELQARLNTAVVGQATPVGILRGGLAQTIPVTIGERT